MLKMKVKTTDKAKVFRRIEKRFGEMNDLHIVVGVPKGAKARDDDEATMAQVAFYNEFGVKKPGKGSIPERSFLRATVDENSRKYTKMYEKLMGAVLEGKIDVKRAMGLLGEMAKADVQKKIRSGVPPVNASSTIRQKGSTKTLIGGNKATGYVGGQLYQSITYEVRDGKPKGTEA